MFYKNLIAVTLTAVLGTVGVSAVEHGDVAEFAGEQYRWHQIARDVWTGVPVDEWSEHVHISSEVELFDIGQVVDRDAPPSWNVEAEAFARDLDELESRQLREACDYVINCFKDTRENWTIDKGLGALVKALEFARSKDKKTKIWKFLAKKPIMATFREGNITFMIESVEDTGETPDECSAEDNEDGFFWRMMSTAIRMLPEAFSASLSFVADGRKLSFIITSAPIGQVPVTHPECTDETSG